MSPSDRKIIIVGLKSVHSEFYVLAVSPWVRLLLCQSPYPESKSVVHWEGLRREPLEPTIGFLEVFLSIVMDKRVSMFDTPLIR